MVKIKKGYKFMKDIKILVDTSADMPAELAEKYNIGVIPFLSIFGEETYVAGVNLTNEEFFEKLEASEQIPTTSQTPYGDMYDYLLKEAKEHDTVIYFTISGKASGQNHSANLAAEEVREDYPEADLHIVDTETFSLYIAATAIYAHGLIEQGADTDEVIAKSKEYLKTWKAYLLVDTLKYLEKGGRITKATAVVGTLLDIKPILGVQDGLIGNIDKIRGKKKLVDKLIGVVTEDEVFDSENPEFLIVHSDDKRGLETKEKLEEMYGEGCVKIYNRFGPIVGTHVGPGGFAIISRVKQQ